MSFQARFIPRWTLARKVIVSVNIASLIALSGLAFVMTTFTSRELKTALHTKIDSMTSFIVKSSSAAIFNLDVSMLEEYVKVAKSDSDVQYVVFLNEKMEPLTSGSAVDENPAYHHITRTISGPGGKAVGHLKMGYSMDRINASIKKSVMLIFSSILIVQLLLTLTLMLIVRPISRSLSKMLGDLGSVSESLKVAAQMISDGSRNLASSNDKQSSSLQQTAASVDEISALIERTISNAEKSTNEASDSHSIATMGRGTFSEMLNAMKEVEENSSYFIRQTQNNNRQMQDILRTINEIGDKTRMIDDIVFQTKLLSFNASVEAARAGEHGKGFAVVAEEVGKLAASSGTAAKEITELLSRSTEKTKSIVRDNEIATEKLVQEGRSKMEMATAIAEKNAAILDKIVNSVGSVKEMVRQISAAAKEQGEGVREVVNALNTMERVTEANAENSRQAADNSQDLLNLANSLHEVVEVLEYTVLGSG